LRAILVAAGVLVVLSTVFPVSAAFALAGGGGTATDAPWPRDPWYRDLHGHWARDDIEDLWRLDVADGWAYHYPPAPWWSYARFQPKSVITRGQLTLLLARAFDLAPLQPTGRAFTDVSRRYREYGDKPACGFIEAAAAAGIVRGDGRGRLRPRDGVRRETAVGDLVRALELEEYAQSLAVSEVEGVLRRFRDGSRVDPSHRRHLAVAVLLGVVQGYPDRTLRPRRLLTRAEAGTLVRRSCLFCVRPAPAVFSPDGDGIEDTTVLVTRSLRNHNVDRWRVEIRSESGYLVRWFGPDRRRRPRRPPQELTWSGDGRGGVTLPPGTYLVGGWIEDSDGDTFHAVPQPVVIEACCLEAALEPDRSVPGDRLALRAVTRGRALTVKAQPPGDSGATGPTLFLYPTLPPGAAENEWAATYMVSPAAGAGRYELLVRAEFAGGGVRECRLEYVVDIPLRLEASLAPAVTPAGSWVMVSARTQGGADGVTCDWPPTGEWLELQADGGAGGGGTGAAWSGRLFIPETTLPNTYPVRVTARRGAAEVRQELSLTVVPPELGWDDLTFFLAE